MYSVLPSRMGAENFVRYSRFSHSFLASVAVSWYIAPLPPADAGFDDDVVLFDQRAGGQAPGEVLAAGRFQNVNHPHLLAARQFAGDELAGAAVGVDAVAVDRRRGAGAGVVAFVRVRI